ncbi:hypothetical protein AOQ84DRAFT_429161 [Glonium stellatum]|uniref:Fe2OG dioxygenase domain-containing protein n=1 Tax=Glonium stellatum TaxID=574774 RepID=A0A8E2FBJ9_9PEZI|nr:hypothetical protein AOQ84DRAFT_429161 [Glonium stellatum]
MDEHTFRDGARTLGETANAALLAQLSSSIEEQAAEATFAQPGKSDPAAARSVQVPITNSQAKYCRPNTSGNLEQLIKDCQPATFGFKGKDVYDESYRKASKLDASAFCSSFNPYELGIIDTIAQVLLPSIKEAKNMRGVRAELYKLNIYSGPSGKFQAHVDTPRSDSQFGSLVVCLPCDHEGGELIIRHQGKSLSFDWSNSALGEPAVPCVQWAAFYSDCEHEVLEVQSGHRITLTYNLYVSRGSGNLAGNCPWMDPKQLPLYDTIQRMLQVPGFMMKGGTLGIWCSHAYAHSSEPSVHNLPSSLKGVDMAMYEIFRALGLQVAVRPILDTLPDDDYSAEEDEEDDANSLRRSRGDVIGKGLRKFAVTELSTQYHRMDDIYEEWGEFYRDEVVWLSKLRHREPAVAFLAYGNEASVAAIYSGAALIVKIPPFLKRNV